MSAEIAGQPAGSPSAGEHDLQIPKHRLDQVLEENRRLKEEQSIKDQLYLAERQRSVQQQPQGPQLPSAEDLGLDPTTYKAVTALSQKIAGSIVAQKETQLNAQFGALFERTEQAQLVAVHGAGSVSRLPEIKRRQEEHFRATGGFLPAETALKLLIADEKDAEITKLRAQIAAAQSGQPAQTQSQPQAQAQPARGLPNSVAAQGLPGGGSGGQGQGGSKSFGESTLEEMEAALQAQFGQGQTL